jgi:CRISPR-associated protein Cas1
VCFVTPGGKFLARVTGPVKDNVFLRKYQIETFSDPEKQTVLIRNLITLFPYIQANLLDKYVRENCGLSKSDFRVEYVCDCGL